MIKWCLTILFLFVFNFVSVATIYYISPSGNDANNGITQTTTWRTVSRVQQASLTAQPGDQFLFQRGGAYSGQLTWGSSGTLSSNIIIGDYGSGSLPVIDGDTPTNNWVLYSGNIYRTIVSGSVKYLFSNGILQPLARYPNSGWIRVNTCTTTQLTSTDIVQPTGYWNGGTLVLRNTHFSYENKTITTHTNNSITFPSLIYQAGNYNWGFYLCNKLSALDSPGEWFHDTTTGYLYFWASGNVNPNTIAVTASVVDYGVSTNSRNYLTIRNLNFKGQKIAGIYVNSSNITVENCVFEKTYHGIFTSNGQNNLYTNNTFRNTYATALAVYDNNSTISNSTFTDIALIGGMGESVFGYFGLRVGGGVNSVINNRMTNVGYSGIFVGETTLVEKNVVQGFCATINDGGGIYWDNANGMVVQDNIINTSIGNLESAATNYPGTTGLICPGLYFGNAIIQNNIVRRNTITNCDIGILVDHTMITNNNQIKDNIIFGNGVQMVITDISNSNSSVPGNVSPFYRATFNEVFSGNQLYSLSPSKLCMEIYNWYGQGNVDFGTFTNNKIFNPYDPLSIRNWNLGTNPSVKTYTLEHWQSVRNEELGSGSSPILSQPYTTTSQVGSNLLINGTFNVNVNDWGGFPTPPNATVTRDLTYLDNGALKANLVTGSEQYMYNQTSFQLQSGRWYRLKFSLQSSINGVVYAQIKEESQLATGNSIFAKEYPFGPNRRDFTVYFQSNVTSPSRILLSSKIAEPTYWLDNVELVEVSTQPVNPTDEHKLLINEQSSEQLFTKPLGCWVDINGLAVGNGIPVAPFSSKIIYKIPGECVQENNVSARVLLGGPLNSQTGFMTTLLRTQNLFPIAEPYSNLGIVVSNPNQQASQAVMALNGIATPVDWVLLELWDSNGVIERKSVIVQSNGNVIDALGNSQISFTNNVVGKKLSIRHRNHLGVITSTVLTGSNQFIDFTNPQILYGTNKLNEFNALWSGDVNMDGVVKYVGVNNDRDVVLIAIGGVVLTNTVEGYLKEDLNLDGIVKYSGQNNDRDIILYSIGGMVPTNTIIQQIP